jgi:hypothetical protein
MAVGVLQVFSGSFVAAVVAVVVALMIVGIGRAVGGGLRKLMS